MAVAVVALDTRGGVQPYAALALGLQEAGHDVRMVAPAEFVPWLAGLGLDAHPAGGDTRAAREDGVAEMGRLARTRYMSAHTAEQVERAIADVLHACEGADLLLGGVGGSVAGRPVAEKLGVPFVDAHLHPIGPPTAAFPGVLLPRTPRFAWKASHGPSRLGATLPFRAAVRRARRDVLGLPTRPAPVAHTLPALYGYSRHVLAAPPEWGPRHRVTGYWTLPGGGALPAELEAFLDAGPPPVCIGFGSMTGADPAALTTLVLDAVRRAGVRAVLLSGWGALVPVAREDVLVVDEAPHDLLFPRAAAVVHHGGAGTTGAALRAGVPAVVVPFAVDQPFWGARVAALGVGPTPVPRRRLTADALAGALRAAADPGMRARAAALGRLVRAEDGVADAVTAMGGART